MLVKTEASEDCISSKVILSSLLTTCDCKAMLFSRRSRITVDKFAIVGN